MPALKRSRREKNSSIQVRALLMMGLLCLSVFGLLAAPVPMGKPANYPAWWFTRGVIAQTDTNTPPSWPGDYPIADDYAGINQGQLKNFATQAYSEMEADLPAYAQTTSYWTNLSTMVNGWNPTNGDAYAAVNLGQLKTVAAPFYNVLINLGYTNNYPWTGVGADDYTAANIGQAKNAFSFDPSLDTNGLPFWWEMKYFGRTGLTASSSPDNNGFTLAQDYACGANPTNYYSQPNGSGGSLTVVPSVTSVSGNNQVSTAGNYTDTPLVVQVTNSNGGAVLAGAPVTFTVTAGSGQVLVGYGGALAATASVITSANGDAQIYFQQPSANGATSTLSATTAGQGVTFTETTSAGNGTLDAPSNGTVTRVSETEIDLTWVNHATAATYIVVQDSTNNGATWTSLTTTLSPTATGYAATGLTPGTVYQFRICAGN